MADEVAVAPAPPAKPARIIDRIGVPEIVDLTLIFGMLAIIFSWIVFKPDPNNQLLTSLITAWASMTALIVSFHRGTSAGQNKLMDKVPAPAAPPPPVPRVPTPWWSKLTEAEKSAISAAAPGDARVQAVMSATIAGSATDDDLAYLVTANLLTAERAAAIKAT